MSKLLSAFLKCEAAIFGSLISQIKREKVIAIDQCANFIYMNFLHSKKT
jgi:hypothetical protein